MVRLWLAVGLVAVCAQAASKDVTRKVDGEMEIGVTAQEEITRSETSTTINPDTVNGNAMASEPTEVRNIPGTSDYSENIKTKDYTKETYIPDEDPIDNSIDDTLGSDDIIDVIKNFIAERDPMLQLFLSICFLHPTCYELENPTTSLTSHTISSLSPLSQELAQHLSARRTETARNMLVEEVMKVQEKIKLLMFKYIQEGVGARGVSILATKTIIDSIKNIWISLNNDLEYAKSSIQELFYLLPLDTKEQVEAMVEIAEVVQKIPKKTDELLQEATQEGYEQYVRSSSWNSWKRKENV